MSPVVAPVRSTMRTPSAGGTHTTGPYEPPPPGTVLRPPLVRPDSRGYWAWVDGPRQWAGLDLPLVRDPIFWVWAFFMAVTTTVTLWTQTDTDKAVSILVVSWVVTTLVYWFVPALTRQVWRTRSRARVAAVEHHSARPR